MVRGAVLVVLVWAAACSEADDVAVVEDDQLIETKVRELVEVSQISREKMRELGVKSGARTALACVAGGAFGFLFSGGGPAGAALGCKVAAGFMALSSIMDQLGKHWTEQMRRAWMAWKLYAWSYQTLDSNPWDDDTEVARNYRACAKKHHPDKRSELDNEALQWHLMKFANCKFSRAFIKVFRAQWGDLAAHRRTDMRSFIESHAGVWADTFGQQVEINDRQLEEVVQSLRLRTEL